MYKPEFSVNAVTSVNLTMFLSVCAKTKKKFEYNVIDLYEVLEIGTNLFETNKRIQQQKINLMIASLCKLLMKMLNLLF